jgi:hypothetical protein
MPSSMIVRILHLLLVAALLAACQVGAVEPAATSRAAASPRLVAAPPSVRATPEPIERPRPSGPPPPAATATPAPTATPTPATTFAFNLFEEGDFVPQHTFEWCVGASIQIAHNLVRADRRSSYEDQQALWELARTHSTNSFNGANPRGWATALDEIGIGPYQLVSIPAYEDALRTAAAAIRDTGRPVGLVMWRGRHAWVMSGFESVGDPAIHEDFEVSGVRVLDPLFPHGSGTWGPSPQPNALLSPAELANQFVIREPRRWSSELPAGYLLVLPVEREAAT